MRRSVMGLQSALSGFRMTRFDPLFLALPETRDRNLIDLSFLVLGRYRVGFKNKTSCDLMDSLSRTLKFGALSDMGSPSSLSWSSSSSSDRLSSSSSSSCERCDAPASLPECSPTLPLPAVFDRFKTGLGPLDDPENQFPNVNNNPSFASFVLTSTELNCKNKNPEFFSPVFLQQCSYSNLQFYWRLEIF